MAHPPLRHLRSAVDNARPDGALMAEGQIAMNYAAATPAMFIKDSAGQAVKVGPTHVGATAPNATPAGSAGNSLGESWLDTSGAEPVFKVWDGAQWITAGGGGATVTTDDVAPAAPSDGDLWWDSASTTLFVWYDDGDSAQWVQIGGGGSGGGGGTATAIVAGEGLTGGTITETGAVALDTVYTDGRYVNVTGDQMTGNLTVPSLNGGQLAGFRNVLINGDMRINQRGVTIAAAANGAYGPDRWKKVDAANMTQIVEAGNFTPGAVYTLSGTGVTTQQLTAPASGHWTLPNIPITATRIQLEPGPVATPFEQRPIGAELALCQRYYEQSAGTLTGLGMRGYSYHPANGSSTVTTDREGTPNPFCVEKRTSATITTYSFDGTAGAVSDVGGPGTVTGIVVRTGTKQFNVYASTYRSLNVWFGWTASAEL